MSDSITWFEIPVTDMARARKFYEAVMATSLKVDAEGMAIFPSEGTTGCLATRPSSKPSRDGVRIYLNAGKELEAVISRVEKAGGKLVLPKTSIGPNGWIAVMADLDGNEVGLHQA
jgi:predicted enzyme related to lactoylglutathione lyase